MGVFEEEPDLVTLDGAYKKFIQDYLTENVIVFDRIFEEKSVKSMPELEVKPNRSSGKIKKVTKLDIGKYKFDYLEDSLTSPSPKTDDEQYESIISNDSEADLHPTYERDDDLYVINDIEGDYGQFDTEYFEDGYDQTETYFDEGDIELNDGNADINKADPDAENLEN